MLFKERGDVFARPVDPHLSRAPAFEFVTGEGADVLDVFGRRKEGVVLRVPSVATLPVGRRRQNAAK